MNVALMKGGFIAAIQGQLLATTIGIPARDETIAFRAINSFFMGGLVLDIMAAMLGYLTSRWLQRMTDEEKDFLEETFARRDAHDQEKVWCGSPGESMNGSF